MCGGGEVGGGGRGRGGEGVGRRGGGEEEEVEEEEEEECSSVPRSLKYMSHSPHSHSHSTRPLLTHHKCTVEASSRTTNTLGRSWDHSNLRTA